MDAKYRVSDILAILLLAALTTAAFFHMYLPSRQRNEDIQQQLLALSSQRDAAMAHVHTLTEKRDRLFAKEPEMIETAIRQELRWGRSGEALIPQRESTPY